jgi:hypothetical protein
MRPTRLLLSLSLAGIAAACGPIPVETDPPPGGREIAPAGILRGNVVYSGPHPCSADGHVVGAAILFVFDRRNPPPPNGTASTPVNFGVVTGDVLFASEPRNTAPSTYCPLSNGVTDAITTSAPFTISPMAGGSYIIQAFYDYTGDFLPTFKFRNLPEKGDIAGGDLDTVDALKPSNAGNPNYQPHFIPVDVGVPEPLPAGAAAGGIPDFTIPDTGFVTDNVTVTLGEILPSPRPYFYPGGLQVTFDPSSGNLTTTEVQSSAGPPKTLANIKTTVEKDPNFDPVLTMPSDIQVLAPPVQNMVQGNVNNFESKLPHLLLHAGLPPKTATVDETSTALGNPFHFQLPPAGIDFFPVWQNALFDANSRAWVPQDIPEGNGVPSLWPLVVLTKLVDVDVATDPEHAVDPGSTIAQGDATHPVVIVQGITLLAGDGSGTPQPDSLFNTAVSEEFGTLFDLPTGQPNVFQQDHLTVLLRPAVICFNTLFDPNNPDKRGTVVTPTTFAMTADLTGATMALVVPPSAILSPALSGLVNAQPIPACLPQGRYAINVVYPDGQAWTVPNESGACTAAEGASNDSTLSCTVQPRPILYSQGTRAVVEITPPSNPANCAGAAAVPAVCLPVGSP